MKNMSKLLAMILGILLIVMQLAMPASAASKLKADDFVQVFTTGITVGDTNDGVSLTFGGGRVTYMKPVQLDGLKIVMKQVSFRAPTEDAGVGLWMTFSQEAGHYWGTGATGTIFRFNNSTQGVSAYVKKADDMDDAGDDIFLPTTGIGLKGFPISITLTFNKVGDQYEVSMNGATFTVDAAAIDATMSSSGKCFWNVGVNDTTGYGENSLIVAEITNTKSGSSDNTTTTTTTTTADAGDNGNGGNDVTPTTTGRTANTAGVGNNTTGGDVENDGGMGTLVVVLIVVLAVVVIGGAAVIVILLKKLNKN